LKPPEKADVSIEKYDGESDKEQFDDDQKVCCGFFFKVTSVCTVWVSSLDSCMCVFLVCFDMLTSLVAIPFVTSLPFLKHICGSLRLGGLY
jgi:hypothetical protein